MRLQLPKLTHKGWAVLGVCLVVPIAATVFLACSMAYTRKKAGGLLRDIQTLKVGESKIVDAHLLLKRYGRRFEKLTSPGYPGADDLDLFISVQYKLLEEWLVARGRFGGSFPRRRFPNQAAAATSISGGVLQHSSA